MLQLVQRLGALQMCVWIHEHTQQADSNKSRLAARAKELCRATGALIG